MALDSGATDHMSNNKDALSDFKGFVRPKDIQLGDESIIKSYGSGTVRLRKIPLKSVLYALKISLNLISLKTIAREVTERHVLELLTVSLRIGPESGWQCQAGISFPSASGARPGRLLRRAL